jgi:hypothetical protein
MDMAHQVPEYPGLLRDSVFSLLHSYRVTHTITGVPGCHPIPAPSPVDRRPLIGAEGEVLQKKPSSSDTHSGFLPAPAILFL